MMERQDLTPIARTPAPPRVQSFGRLDIEDVLTLRHVGSGSEIGDIEVVDVPRDYPHLRLGTNEPQEIGEGIPSTRTAGYYLFRNISAFGEKEGTFWALYTGTLISVDVKGSGYTYVFPVTNVRKVS